MDRKGDFRARATFALTLPMSRNLARSDHSPVVPVELEPGPPGSRYRFHQIHLDFSGFTLFDDIEVRRSLVTAVGLKLPGKPGVAHGYDWGTAVNSSGEPVGNYFAEFSESYTDDLHLGRWAITFGTGQLEGIEAVAAIWARRLDSGDFEMWLTGSYLFP